MTRFRKSTVTATLWLAAIAALAAGPVGVAAQDCTSGYIQCIMENGSSTICIHEYVDCIARSIVSY